MKKLFYLGLVVFFYNTMFASDLFISVTKNTQVAVTVNNQKQVNNFNSFQFYNLTGGNTYIRINDKWTGFKLFETYLNIPIGYQMSAEYDNFGNFKILSSVPVYPTYGNGNQGGYYPNQGGYGQNNPHKGKPNYGNKGYGNNDYGNGSYNNNNNVYFNQFLQSLSDESFDSNRLKAAKAYLQNNQLYAQQIQQVASLFSFDSYRLDWAKAAYPNCIDKGNYFLLKSTFSFSSYYNDLVDYTSKF